MVRATLQFDTAFDYLHVTCYLYIPVQLMFVDRRLIVNSLIILWFGYSGTRTYSDYAICVFVLLVDKRLKC